METNLHQNDTPETPFLYDPTVFVVGQDYQIVFLTREPGIGWVNIAGQRYKDTINGVVRSARDVHCITIPQAVLDEARAYTIGFCTVPDRGPYHPASGPHYTASYSFRPVDETDGLQLYMLADTHSHVTAPSAAAGFFGDALDALILAGDIGNSAKSLEHVFTIHRIAAAVTHGQRPVLFARGNHDTRGAVAEALPDYVGNEHGNTFFSFRIGSLWGVVLDCGEDKYDEHPEYGEIANYRPFREAQTAYLRRLIMHADHTFNAPGVKTRIAVCHLPFTRIVHDFADDIYDEWTRLLNQIGIDFMLSGHCHKTYVDPRGRVFGEKVPANFPVVVGARACDHPLDPDAVNATSEFTASAVEIKDGLCTLRFTNSQGEVVKTCSL